MYGVLARAGLIVLVCKDLNRLLPMNNLGELRWYAGCHYSRVGANGLLKISQKACILAQLVFCEKVANDLP